MIFWLIAAGVVSFGFVVFFGAPYVPTRRRQLAVAFDELYKLGPKDVLVDIGSGDGAVLLAAAARGAHAIGYELNPILVVVSKLRCRGSKNITIRWANMWQQNLPAETTVVYGFMEQHYLRRTTRYLQAQANLRKKPIYFISYAFLLAGYSPQKTVGAFHLYKF